MARKPRTVSDTPAERPRSVDSVRTVAQKALLDIAADRDAPAAARAAAARTLLEMEGAIGRNQEPPRRTADKPLAALTRAELEAELAALRQTGPKKR